MCKKEIKAALQTKTAGEECGPRVEQLLQRLVLPQIGHLLKYKRKWLVARKRR